MNAVDKIEELFEQSPQDPDLQILKQFCLSLEAGKPFDLRLLASLTFESFNLGIDLPPASRTKVMAVSPQILENCGYEDHTIYR